MSEPRRTTAWVLTIGDELLRGEIVDSNKSFLSERLLGIEIETTRHVTVADDADEIAAQLRAAVASARVVLVSGGLGPTRDDITTAVVASTFDRPLVRRPEEVDRIRAFFESIGREMAENNAKQADFPEGAEVLSNPLGTAPGFMLAVEGSLVFCMPGVPRELYRMVDDEVVPRLRADPQVSTPRGVVRARLLRTFGLGESTLDQELSDLSDEASGVVLGFRTQFPDNLVRVVARGADAATAEARLEAAVAEVERRLGDIVVGAGDRPLEAIVGELLIEGKHTVALAESCTGGLIASLLTDVPGSSGYLLEGVVAYSNEAKVRDLGVSAADLEAHGAVSQPVAEQMARGVRERSGAELALATTGIAGPGGGTDEKPVGTVWVALATSDSVSARRYQLFTDRSRNKRLTAQIALDWLRRQVQGLELPDETFPRLRGTPRGTRRGTGA
ncbi:MAG: competence/damage-inducible protein A [Deltaproteobacteria bacterium]|nr:competence/damage-inducible protein A [Deltaproteobacteria bacterium]MBW2414545.1 competence/damage-inducible protein A [Deltaproteobacteria bacterium]